MMLLPTPELTVLQPQVRLGDPHVSSDDKNSLSIIFNMYEALVRYNGSGGYLPALAESWTLEDDACTWTFNLRAHVPFHNGDMLVLKVPTILPDEAPHLARCMAGQYALVGITTEIREFTDRPGYADMVRAKQMDDACCFDSSPLSTYRVLREKLHSGVRGPWWQGYINPEVDALIDQAQATADNARRQDLYRRAYRMIHDDAPWIFLYHPILFWGVGPRARGWAVGIDGLIRLV